MKRVIFIITVSIALFSSKLFAMYPPPVMPDKIAIASDKSTMPYEIRLGEDIDFGVQFDSTSIFCPRIVWDRDINHVNLNGPYIQEKISKKRIRLKIDKAALSRLTTEELEGLVGYKNFTSDFSDRGNCLGDYSDHSDGKVYVRTQNGFQRFIVSDFNKSELAAVIRSIIPGMGYYYAEEEGEAWKSAILRAVLLFAYFRGSNFTPVCPILIAVTFINEARDSAKFVYQKDVIAKELREKKLDNEAQLLAENINAISEKPKKSIKYPKIPFGVTLGMGVRLFPIKSRNTDFWRTYRSYGLGFRDLYVDFMKYTEQDDDFSVRVLTYEDFYAFGFKNLYYIGYDNINNATSFNAGIGKGWHSEWVDFKFLINFGQYDNPISLSFEGSINLAPLTLFDGTYPEIQSPYK